MQLILGMLSVDIGFQITGNQLVITTIAPVRKIEQHLTFNANTTMADGMNPLVPGREIIKVFTGSSSLMITSCHVAWRASQLCTFTFQIDTLIFWIPEYFALSRSNDRNVNAAGVAHSFIPIMNKRASHWLKRERGAWFAMEQCSRSGADRIGGTTMGYWASGFLSSYSSHTNCISSQISSLYWCANLINK